MATLVPFYHGGLRHLHETYADSAVVRPALILWDFVLLFMEACLLLAAATSVTDPRRAALLLGVLWFVDIVWVLGSRLLGQHPPMTWAIVNAGAIACVGALLVFRNDDAHAVWATALALIALGRTSADYVVSKDFYFPPHELGRADA